MSFLKTRVNNKFIFKKRVFTLFSFRTVSHTSWFSPCVVAKATTKLTSFNLSTLVSTLKKLLTRRVKLSRKMRFRKKKEPKPVTKDTMTYTSTSKLFSYGKKAVIKTLKFRKKRKNKIVVVNVHKLPLSKKPLNMRMGKGKGSIKKWEILIKSGSPLLLLNFWHIKKSSQILSRLSLVWSDRFHFSKAIFNTTKTSAKSLLFLKWR
jgi:hypothetical protein